MSVSVFVKASVRRFLLCSAISLSATVAMGASLEWNTNLRESKKQSQETGKPLLIYFYSDTSAKSKACDASTFADSSVAKIVKSNFVPIKINASEAPATARHYQAANESELPLVVLIGADGKEKSRFAVSEKPTEFLALTIPHLSTNSSASTAVAKNAASTSAPSAAPTAGLPDLKAMAATAQQSTADLTKAVTNQTTQATQSALGQVTQTFDTTRQAVTQQAETAKQQFDTAKQNAAQQLATAKNTLSEQATAVTSSVSTQTNQLVNNGTTAVSQGIGQFSNNLSAGSNNLLAKVQSAAPSLPIGTAANAAASSPANGSAASVPPPYNAPVSSPFNVIAMNQPATQIASAAKVEPPSYSKVGSIYDPGYMPKTSNNAIAGNSPYNAPLPANPAVQSNATTPVLPSSMSAVPVIGAQMTMPSAVGTAPIGSGYGNPIASQPTQQPQYNQQLPPQQYAQAPVQSAPQNPAGAPTNALSGYSSPISNPAFSPNPSAATPPTSEAQKAAILASSFPKKEVKPISAYSTENYEKYMVEKAGASASINPAAIQTPILPGTAPQANPALPPQNNFMPPAVAPQNPMASYSQPQSNIAPNRPVSNLPQNVGLDGFCPVHLREGKSWKKGDPRFGANHRGKIYLFASDEAQKKFMANPDYYSPAMGGNDPVMIFSKGQYVAGKREYGMVLGERLYLFADPASRDEMIKNQQSYISAIQLAERTAGGNIVR